MSIQIEDANGVEHQLPTRFELCPRCQGHGTHTNPAIDGHGISPEEFAEDPDFEDAYFAGRYDVTCQDCNGLRVIEVVDEERLTQEQHTAWESHLEAEREYQRDYASERWLRMAESGGY